MENINWSNLVAKGRAKAHGVPWTEEEAKARAAGVSAEDIRDGVWKSGVVSVPNESAEISGTGEISGDGSVNANIDKVVIKKPTIKKAVKKSKK